MGPPKVHSTSTPVPPRAVSFSADFVGRHIFDTHQSPSPGTAIETSTSIR